MSFASVLKRLQRLENPYPGLRPFERQEQHLFFGRDQQVAELVARLERNRFVAVVGVSGSGKSSLVRAGLLPALERGSVGEARARWRMIVTRPAGTPFVSLAADLLKDDLDPSALRRSSHGLVHVARKLPPQETLLVVVDQFEELFRYKDREPVTNEAKRTKEATASEAAEFVQLLLTASRQQPPVFIVLTMRSDYLGDCAEFRDLPETLNACQYLVPRLTREQRKEAIEGPLTGTTMAPSLVQRILNDAGDEPDQLPVLQHALMYTWSEWRRSDPVQERRIEVQDYEAAGGFENALNLHAERLLKEVSEEIVATIFKRLTARGRGDRERRDPAALAELWAVCGAVTPEQQSSVTAVVEHFRRGDATFLLPREGDLTPETYIDITHESLIRKCRKLHDEWLPQESKSAKTFLYLLERAASWKAGKGALLPGLDLTEAVEWNRQRNQTAAWANHYAGERAMETVLEFIAASQAQERKRAFRAKLNFWIAAALALLFAALASVAGYEWHRADVSDDIVIAQQFTTLSEQMKQQTDLEPATLLAIEAFQRAPVEVAERVLRELTRRTAKPLSLLTHQDAVSAVAFSPDGRSVATGSFDNTARVFEAATGKELARLTHQDAVNAVAFSPPDGRLVATGSDDHTARIFVAATGKELARLSHKGAVNAVAFSPDGRFVATGSDDNTAYVFVAATGKELARLSHKGRVNAVAFSPDGRFIATGSSDDTCSDGTARVFEVATGTEFARFPHKGRVNAVAFSPPDGRHLATASYSKTASVFDVAKRTEVAPLNHQEGAVNGLAFSSDGRFVATGSSDSTARVFEVATGKELARLTHEGQVFAVAFSPDGRAVATGSSDYTARVFEVATEPQNLIHDACSHLRHNLTPDQWRELVGDKVPYHKTCRDLP